jgi:hypothetical protein
MPRSSAHLLALAAALLLLLGCATPEQQAAEARQIAVVDDRYRPWREYISGTIKTAERDWSTGRTLVARIDRATGAATFVLHLQIAYLDRHYRHYDIARNERAEMLPVRRINREYWRCRQLRGCAHAELIEIELAEPMLRALPPHGLALKVFPRLGPEGMVSLPQALVASLVARVDADRRPGPVAGAAERR